MFLLCVFFFKQKTAYEMRISDWSSDVCSSDLAGLTAGGGTLNADDLLRPGRLAGTGFSAAWPLLQQVNQYLGFATFFQNFLAIAVLLIAWLIVILAFFIFAVQMFVCILEFKLTSLAGFILVPFALWTRNSFLAERRSEEPTSELQ